ncbi:hypothetical protein L7F22_019390 [Adiantum nelumboides]|nr:hypothetical protein [Adiantum nelumboides]
MNQFNISIFFICLFTCFQTILASPIVQHPLNVVNQTTKYTGTKASTDDKKVGLAKLWSQLEAERPVKIPNITTVPDAPLYIPLGPDPQRQTMFTSHSTLSSKSDYLKFSKEFLYGVASSAPQSEGAVMEDGRGPSIWDSFAHLTNILPEEDRDAFDIGTNFRYLYTLDIARVKAMGMKAFSFSISWSRVMPMGYGEINMKGMQFYIDLVEEIRRQGLEPIATLFHWDLPLQLEVHYGGFRDEQIVDDFTVYAEAMFKALGKHVDKWITFNEPQSFCIARYPFLSLHIHKNDSSSNAAALLWQCAGHILKAHGKTYEIFKTLKEKGAYLNKKSAMISYKNAGGHSVLYRDGNKNDQKARERVQDFYFGLFAEPIYLTGQYPGIIRDEIPKGWLPIITDEDRKRIKGSADFMATDFFSSRITKSTERQGGFEKCVGNITHIAWPACTDFTDTLSDGTLIGERSDKSTEKWLMNTAGQLRDHLRCLAERYPTKNGIYITEIGWAERGESEKTSLADIRHDDGRQRYLRDHLAEMLWSIYKDGTPLKGILFWSATSAIEWEQGRTPKFGLQSIDYSSANLTRTYLGSFFFLKHFFEQHVR